MARGLVCNHGKGGACFSWMKRRKEARVFSWRWQASSCWPSSILSQTLCMLSSLLHVFDRFPWAARPDDDGAFLWFVQRPHTTSQGDLSFHQSKGIFVHALQVCKVTHHILYAHPTIDGWLIARLCLHALWTTHHRQPSSHAERCAASCFHVRRSWCGRFVGLSANVCPLCWLSLGDTVWGMRPVFWLSSGHDWLVVAMLEVNFGHGGWLEDWQLGS